MYDDIDDIENSSKYLDQLLILNKYYLDEKERNLYMIITKKKYNLIKKKLNILREKQYYNNPNIITTYIKENILANELAKVEMELRDFCQDVVNNIENVVYNLTNEDNDSLIFFQKLKADFLKYLLDLVDDDEDKLSIENECQAMYQASYELCNYLSPYSPLVLSTILNYSVFLYHVNNDTQLALDIADSGYTNCILALNGRMHDKVNYIINIIQENMETWKKELALKK